jgi:hypothetical protein
MSKNISKQKIEQRNIELCDVLYTKDNEIAFNFKGYGIICTNKLNINAKKVRVSYKNNIGDSNFEFQIVK